MFADYEFGPVNDDDFVLVGTGFLGAEVGLDALSLGLEYRYLLSEDTEQNFAIEGHSGMVCLRLSF